MPFNKLDVAALLPVRVPPALTGVAVKASLLAASDGVEHGVLDPEGLVAWHAHDRGVDDADELGKLLLAGDLGVLVDRGEEEVLQKEKDCGEAESTYKLGVRVNPPEDCQPSIQGALQDHRLFVHGAAVRSARLGRYNHGCD